MEANSNMRSSDQHELLCTDERDALLKIKQGTEVKKDGRIIYENTFNSRISFPCEVSHILMVQS